MAFDVDGFLKKFSGISSTNTVTDNSDEEDRNTSSLSSFNPDEFIKNASQNIPENNQTIINQNNNNDVNVIPENHKRYDYAFEKAATKYNIPKELFYSFLPVENNDANPEATGPLIENPKSVHYGDRALGLFQIMPKTAEALDARSGQQRDPLNPEDNADLFAQHIREALDRYGKDDYEDAIVDFFSGPQGVELYKQGKGNERNDSNLTIDQYAQKVVDNFKRLNGTMPITVSDQTDENYDPNTPFNPDDAIRKFLGEEPVVPQKEDLNWVGKTGKTLKKVSGSFRGLFPATASKEDKLAGEKNPNILNNEMFASDQSALGSDIMDPELSDKYKTMAEREGAGAAGVKQALDMALFVKNPIMEQRFNQHPISTTAGTVAGIVLPTMIGGVGATKAATEIPAMVRLAQAGRWGQVTHNAIVRGSTAAAEWLANGGGDQILSDDPEVRKNAILNFTSSFAGSIVSPLPENFAPKGSLQLVLQPAIDGLVQTGVMASFGKNAWDKENIVNTLSQVAMSALFSANDLKKVGGDKNVSEQKVQTETPVNTEIPTFLRKGTSLEQVDKNIEAPGKPVQGWPVADEGYLMGQFPKMGTEDVQSFLKSRTPDEIEAIKDKAKYFANKASGDKLDIGNISAEDAISMLDHAQKKLPFVLKGITIDPKNVSEDDIARATDFTDFFTGQNNKKSINFRNEADEVAYNSKGPLKDGELPGFLRDVSGSEAPRTTEIEQPGNQGKSESNTNEIGSITAKLPEDLDPRTADEFDLRMAGLNDTEISKLKNEIDLLDKERIAYETEQLNKIQESTGEMTQQKQELSASSLLTDIRKDIDASQLDPSTRKDIDRYISGKSSDISVFSMDKLRSILSPRINIMNNEKVDLGGDYGKQQGEWDTEELIRFVQENSKASPLYGKKIGSRVKSNNPNDMFSDQTGDLFGRSAEQQRIAEFQMNRDAERQKKQMKDPLKGTMFDLQQREADATVQEDLFSNQGGLSAGQQKLKRNRVDVIKQKLDEISSGKMTGGQLEQMTGGTATTGNKYAGSINLEKTGVAPEVNKLMEDVYTHYSKNAEASERRPMTKDEIQELADKSGLDMKDILKRNKGQVWNAWEGKAARDINAASAERVFDLIERNQKKATDGTLTENDKLELMQNYYLHAAVQAEVSKNASQTGRALRMHGFLANAASAKQKIKSLKDIMESLGGDPKKGDYIFEKLMTIDPKDTAGLTKFVRKSAFAKTMDGVYEAWINSILSSPTTHAVNATSNLASIAYRTALEKPAAAITDLMISKMKKGRERDRYLREVPQEIFGMWGGLRDAAKAFTTTFKEGMPSGPTKAADALVSQPAIPGKIGSVVRTPTRLLSASDEFFKTLIYRGEIQARAYRKARNIGLKGEELNKKVLEIINDPDDVTKEAAIQEANYRTFTSPLGKFGKAIFRMRNDVPVLKYVLPFIKTPTNVAKFALERTPVIGQAIAAKRIIPKWKEGTITKGEIADEAAKSMVGSALALLVVGLAKSGMITGGGPKEQNKREELYRTGWLPYSLKMGDKYYSYGRLEPLGSIVGIAADYADLDLDKESENKVQDIAAKVAFSFGKNITSKTFLSGISDLIDVISEPERYGSNWVQRMGSSVVPNIINAGAKATDKQLREINTLGDAIIAKVPGLSQTLYGKRDIWGKEIESPATGLEALASPVKVTEEKTDPIDKELLRVEANIGKPGKSITYNGDKIKLSPKEYDYYQQIAGQKARVMVESLLKSSYYKSLPDEEKVKEIRNTIEKARSRVRYKLEQYLKKERKQ